MSGDETKKSRAQNFTSEEVNVFLSVLEKEKNILLNKETNKVTSSAKTKAWIRITDDFNAINPRKLQRETKALQNLWKKYKQDAKSDKASRKVNTFVDFMSFM